MEKNKTKSIWTEHKLYNDEITIEYLDSKHWYHLKGEPRFPLITSVTGATAIYDKSFQLIKWATKIDIDYIQQFVTASAEEVQKSELLLVIAESRDEHNRIKDKAANVGNIVHLFCELFVQSQLTKSINGQLTKSINGQLTKSINGQLTKSINGQLKQAKDSTEDLIKQAINISDLKSKIKFNEYDEVTQKEMTIKIYNGVNAFVKWFNEHEIEFISSERVVYSRQHNFVGKNDFHAIIDGVRTVGDFKTSKGIYDDHLFQLSAYWAAMEEEDQTLSNQGMIIKFDKESGDFEIKTISRDEHEKNYDAFLALLTVKERAKELEKEKRISRKENP